MTARTSSLALCVAVVVLALFASSALAGPTVTVRVEGEAATLLPATPVTLNEPEPVSGCPANSVAAAINLAAAGNWDHGEAFGAGGDFTQTLLGETHEFAHESDTWAEWVNYKWGGGICTDMLSEGDEVLMVADHEPEPFFAPTVLPLVVTEAPAVVQAGSPFNVAVSAVHTAPEAFAEAGQGTPAPIAGATVSGGGASASTAASGVATLTLTGTGTVTLRVTRAGDAPSRPFTVCVHNGSDGNCGTAAGGSGARTGSGTANGVLGGASGKAYTGPYALVANVSGPANGRVYSRGGAPRLLAGTILTHSPVTSVSLELRRSHRGRCWTFDATSARFVRIRCGRGSTFPVASSGTFSYLLPSALKPGRYVLDVTAGDSAGNHTTLARGTSRVVFYVR
ncbi:MAG TPA: hypothetical protein VFW29_10155 [Solirubrobacteraceae bacterium]|nr:hypothetical protein [Solirubrobacteraceae bacterium]